MHIVEKCIQNFSDQGVKCLEEIGNVMLTKTTFSGM